MPNGSSGSAKISKHNFLGAEDVELQATEGQV